LAFDLSFRGRDDGKRITSDSLLDMETGVLKALE
jgi:hypothetical protein